MSDITILIPTYNNSEYLEKMLPKLAWADEIVIVDSFSTDGSQEIGRAHGASVYEHEYGTPAKQKNWALQHCTSEWVFQIDTDEYLETGLVEEILSVIIDSKYEGFKIPRKNHYGQHWLRHGGLYPDNQLRLFMKSVGSWTEREVHEKVELRGNAGTLRSNLVHYGMPSIRKQLSNLDRYTSHECDEYFKYSSKYVSARLILRPVGAFFFRFLFQMGFMDGWHGLIHAAYIACYSFIVQVKIWERSESLQGNDTE